MTVAEEIERVKEELRKIQKNKATEHYIGNLKIRLSKLQSISTARKTGGKSFAVKKQGDATVLLIGFPSVGKSTLLNKLTNAKSRTAAYEFTTLRPVPGMMTYKKAKIQIIDAPGIISGASAGKGGGKQILSLAQGADLLLILLDPEKNRIKTVIKELEESGIRINTLPPKVTIKKTERGGIVIDSTVRQDIDMEILRDILRRFGYANAHIILREKVTVGRFIDALSHRVYVKAVFAFNKCDTLNVSSLKKDYPNALFISAITGKGLDELRERLWRELELKQIYLKEPGKKELGEPLIMKGKVKVKDVAKRVGDYKKAKVWGKSVKFGGQVVSMEHELADGDVVLFTKS